MMKLLMWGINMEKNILYIADTCDEYIYEAKHILDNVYIINRLIDISNNRKINTYSMCSVNRGDIVTINDTTDGARIKTDAFSSIEHTIFSNLDEAMLYGMVNEQV